MKRLLLAAVLLTGSALVLAQGARQNVPVAEAGPGQPGWVGQTVQINPAPAYANTGGLEPADIQKPLSDEWRTYSGDLTGKRYSALKLVNTTNVKALTL